jgi:hypothetical protein
MKQQMRIQLGHPILVFIWSFSMVSIGCLIGIHFHPSRIATLWIAISGALLAAIHEIYYAFMWCALTAWWIGRNQFT